MDKDLCVFGPVSSLLLWRAARCGSIELSRLDEGQPDLERCHARVRDVRQLDLVRMLGDVPLDVIVGNRTKSHSGTLHTIVLAGKMPTDSFVHVRQELYVCAPELCFALLGRGGQMLPLARLGLELCGTYSLTPDQSGRYCTSFALTDKRRLSAFLGLMGRRHGLTVARKALGLVADGSGSPRETGLYLALTAPVRMGGYGLWRPELNAKVSSASDTYALNQLYRDDKGKKVLAVDLCGLGILPKPQSCDLGSIPNPQYWEALARDGLDAVGIGPADIMSSGKLEVKALRIARLLGKPTRASRGLLRQRRRDLFALLFDESFWHVEHETLCQLASYRTSAPRGRRVA